MADNGSLAVDTALKAIAMGHGTECSLEMMPVEGRGYYPCIDIKPYRFVFTYGAVRAFVLMPDRSPYPIMDAPTDEPAFLREGPWNADMSGRVALWWSETIEGGAKRAEAARSESENQRAAEDQINSLNKKPDPPQATPPPTPPPAQSAQDTLEIDEDIQRILAN